MEPGSHNPADQETADQLEAGVAAARANGESDAFSVDEAAREPRAAANGTDEPEEQHPARALTLHLLRMLETRMDAAGIALQTEAQSFTTRLQLRLLAAAAVFIAIWGAIVLLAIALPDPWRIPVLAAVIVGFVVLAVWAQLASKRRVGAREVGSMAWFLEGLKLDLEVLSRALHRARTEPRPPERMQ